MRLLPALLAAVSAAACTKSPAPSEAPAPARDASAEVEPVVEPRSDAMTMNKDPNAPTPSFERGPAITPAGELVAWLDQQDKRLVRLPVTLTLSATGAVASATFGVNGEPDARGFELSDHQMGISLKDRLRKVCKPGGTCAVWLVGQWSPGDKPLLNVRKLDGAIAPDQLAGATHAEVAVE